ncbi:T6SS immunity protein Tli4 family protein [Acinetobacter higginsii]|uniref:T6SS immunity protein Tli4 family protein n=1 Tax=Acinetobacter higginsii TaxID=70347 RepID=UPI002675A85E|nr:T6SS immunity protein Tli4 family protein [Acinetobacter higginsii]MDO3664149.1 T6SS immunity protein Tli4 family protein [Acinetobacter higginsii]
MNKIYTPLLFTTCVFSVGCISAKSDIKNSVNDMVNLETTKSYCIGRYVVEIPAEANPLNRYDQYDSFIIKVKENATRQDFDEAVQKWRSDYSKGNRKIFEDPQEQKIDGRVAKVFKGKLADKEILPYDVAGFVLDQKTLFLIEGGHSNSPARTKKSNEAIQNLVKNLRYRNEHEIPKETGQCIYQGFIKDETKQYRYSIQKLGFRFKDHPTVVLRFEAESNDENVLAMIPRIEKRLKEVGQSQRQIDKKNIRKGEKNTSYLNGQEWISVEKIKGPNGLSALWEHTGSANNQDPLISFEVDTAHSPSGNETNSLAQGEALKLYESILKTIRKF